MARKKGDAAAQMAAVAFVLKEKKGGKTHSCLMCDCRMRLAPGSLVRSSLLDKAAGPLIDEALALVLNIRPAKPLALLAAFFKHKARNLSCEFTAYQYIAVSPRHRQVFLDSLALLYDTVVQYDADGNGEASDSSNGSQNDANGDDPGFTGADMCSLVRTLCADFPPAVLERALAQAGRRMGEPVLFDEYLAAIDATLMQQQLAAEADALFEALGGERTGYVSRTDVDSCLRRAGAAGGGLVEARLTREQLRQYVLQPTGRPQSN